MNILQQELNSINDKLEILNYRKWQLDSIIDEYNDTLERVKNLVSTMNDVNVDPSNLMMEIEKIVYDFEPDEPEETTPDNHELINAHIIPYDPTIHGELLPDTDNHIDDVNAQNPDDVGDVGIDAASPGVSETPTGATEQPSEHFNFDLRLFPHPKPETEQEPETVRLMMMIPMAQPTPEPTPEPIEFIEDGVEDEEYLAHIRNHPKPPATKCEPEPEQPETITATPIQLNTRAWRRGDTLLIGFSNKRLLNAWMKWIKSSWGDRVAMDTYERLSGFPHCLAVLWFGNGKFVDWQRLASIDYSLKPDEQRF